MVDTKLVDNLIKTLQYENRTYAVLLSIAEKKTEYLVENDTALLSGITQEENQLVEQTKQLSKVREQFIVKLCEAMGVTNKGSIEDIKVHLSKAQASTLGDIQKKLKETVMKLIVRNGINQKLIENALKYINFNLEIMTSPAPEVPVYGKSGEEVSPNRKRSMLDIKF